MLRRLLLAAIFGFALPALASAQPSDSTKQPSESTKRAVLDFGLIGVWAGACDEPATPINNHATYALSSSGAITLTYDAGERYEPTRYAIVNAEIVADDKIALREDYLNEKQTLEILVRKDKGRIRVWTSKSTDGRVLVQDGVITNNRETLWLQRCR